LLLTFTSLKSQLANKIFLFDSHNLETGEESDLGVVKKGREFTGPRECDRAVTGQACQAAWSGGVVLGNDNNM
jgi:hypothetical protein